MDAVLGKLPILGGGTRGRSVDSEVGVYGTVAVYGSAVLPRGRLETLRKYIRSNGISRGVAHRHNLHMLELTYVINCIGVYNACAFEVDDLFFVDIGRCYF